MSNALTPYSNEQLEQELARRKIEATQLEEAQRAARCVLLRSVLTRSIVDVLVPEHGRTSCSDRDIRNGFYSNGEESAPRCERCALLQFLEGDGDEHAIRIWFDFTPPKRKV